MVATQTQTNQSSSHNQPQIQPHPQSAAMLQPKSDAANQTIPHQAKSAAALEIKSPTTHSKSVGVEAKQLQPQIHVRSQAMVSPSTKVVQSTMSASIGVSVATVSASAITTTVSTTPVVTSCVVQGTTAVVPIMTSTETSTSPPPSTLVEHVNTQNSVVANGVPGSAMPKESVSCEQQTDSKKVLETETVVPQPVLKPMVVPIKDKQPQKAIVKPQVLTHVIDGFVIQEGPEPFPVSSQLFFFLRILIVKARMSTTVISIPKQIYYYSKTSE